MRLLVLLFLLPFLGFSQQGFFADDATRVSVEQANQDYLLTLSPNFYFIPETIDNSISTWNDSSGNNYTATTSGGTANYIDNSKVTVNASSYLSVTDDPALDVTVSSDIFTVILKFGATINATSGYFLAKSEGSGSKRTFAFLSGSSNSLASVYAGGTLVSTSNVTMTGGELLIATLTTTTLNVWIDGTQVITNAGVGSGNANASPWIIGARIGGAAAINGAVDYEMIAFIKGTAVDATQRLNILNQWKSN